MRWGVRDEMTDEHMTTGIVSIVKQGQAVDKRRRCTERQKNYYLIRDRKQR